MRQNLTTKFNNENVHCHAMILTGTMDLQARAYVMNQTQHNGAHSCLFFEQEHGLYPNNNVSEDNVRLRR